MDWVKNKMTFEIACCYNSTEKILPTSVACSDRPYSNSIAMRRRVNLPWSKLLFSDQTFTWAHKMVTTVTLNSDTK